MKFFKKCLIRFLFINILFSNHYVDANNWLYASIGTLGSFFAGLILKSAKDCVTNVQQTQKSLEGFALSPRIENPSNPYSGMVNINNNCFTIQTLSGLLFLVPIVSFTAIGMRIIIRRMINRRLNQRVQMQDRKENLSHQNYHQTIAEDAVTFHNETSVAVSDPTLPSGIE